MTLAPEVLAAAITVLASLFTFFVTRRTEAAVRDQTHEQARALSDHQTAFSAVHTRRAEILGALYGHIASLNNLAKDWLNLHSVLEEHRNKAGQLDAEQSRERLEKMRARMVGMEQRLVDAYRIMVDAKGTLAQFYRRNRIWLSRETCNELDAWIEPHSTLVARLDPAAHADWLKIAQRLDELAEPMNQTRAELGMPAMARASAVEEMKGLVRQYGEYFVPLLDAGLQRVEDEFRRVLRVS